VHDLLMWGGRCRPSNGLSRRSNDERFREHDRHNAFCKPRMFSTLAQVKKHHDRYAVSGVSCVCLNRPWIIYWVSRSGEGDSQEQKTTLSILMPFDGREHDLSRPCKCRGLRASYYRVCAATRKSKMAQKRGTKKAVEQIRNP